MLVESIEKTLNELADFLSELNNADYTKCCVDLSNATIGEHTRHIVEMFQCIENQYASGTINYDIRKRDYLIQTDVSSAIESIQKCIQNLNKPNISLQIQQIVDGEELLIESNYNRELLYNLEHCVHHQALIKVAVLQNANIKINENFGVARSTIEYRNQCAQ